MNTPAGQIRREIRQNGPMTTARFMELALYLPSCGYYETKQEIGQGGDFYTSVSVGSVFGELLAFQFSEWIGNFPRFSIVEAGAHDGRLAADILGWFSRFAPETLERLEYVLVEPPARRAWQRQMLQDWLARVRWVDSVQDLPVGSVKGVIFSNEFLDAAPIHRLGWDAKERNWREWRVVEEGDRFSWILGELSEGVSAHVPPVPPGLAEVMPDRHTVEISPWAVAWWTRAAASLAEGRLLAIDYGFGEGDFILPQNGSGTFRGYAGHHLADDPLANPGEQDMTAHVQFGALRDVGEHAGLQTEGLVSQAAFLTGILARTQGTKFEEWTPARTRQFQTLTHPDHLGRSFKVLIQARLTGKQGR
jgi:SAM-dependent MidA family methyltransferase